MHASRIYDSEKYRIFHKFICAILSHQIRAAILLIAAIIFFVLPATVSPAVPSSKQLSRRCAKVFESRWVNGYYLYSYSPGDDRFAFVMETEGNTDIWTARRDGRDLQRFTSDPGQDILPSWSPDGQILAFISSRGGTWNLWTMKRDGSGPRKLLSVDKITPIVTEPVWSPDGTQILTISFKGGHWDLWRIDGDGKNPLQLTHDDRNELAFSWIEKGRKILFASTDQGRSHICTMNADGTNQHWLTPDNALCLLPNIDHEGTRIAYVNGGAMNSAVCTMAPDGEEVKTLTTSLFLNTLPKWSPDSRRIAFISNRTGGQEIWSMDDSGLDALQLTSSCGSPFGLRWLRKDLMTFVSYRNDFFTINLLDPIVGTTGAFISTSLPIFQASWSPDGSKVVTTSFDGRKKMLLAINLRNNQGEALFSDAGIDQSFPSWNPRNGLIAFSASENNHESGIWVGNPDNGESKEITRRRGMHILPAWSPDGEFIAFYSLQEGLWHLCLTEAGGSHFKILARTGKDPEESHTPPPWSPDGKFLLNCGEEEGKYVLKCIDIHSGEARTIAATAGPTVNPLFSRDSHYIYYFLITGDREEIWQAEVSSLNRTRLTNSRRTETLPTMCVGAAKIIFTRNGGLWTMDLNGAGKEQLISLEGEQILPLLSPDEKSMLYTAVKGNNRDLWIYK
jgi:Tol biopolymer transport system component